jgi:hypothetical protein
MILSLPEEPLFPLNHHRHAGLPARTFSRAEMNRRWHSRLSEYLPKRHAAGEPLALVEPLRARNDVGCTAARLLLCLANRAHARGFVLLASPGAAAGVGSLGLPLPFASLLQTVSDLLLVRLLASYSSSLYAASARLSLPFRYLCACWLSEGKEVCGPWLTPRRSLRQRFGLHHNSRDALLPSRLVQGPGRSASSSGRLSLLYFAVFLLLFPDFLSSSHHHRSLHGHGNRQPEPFCPPGLLLSGGLLSPPDALVILVLVCSPEAPERPGERYLCSTQISDHRASPFP